MKEARSESVGDQPVRVTVFVRGQGARCRVRWWTRARARTRSGRARAQHRRRAGRGRGPGSRRPAVARLVSLLGEQPSTTRLALARLAPDLRVGRPHGFSSAQAAAPPHAHPQHHDSSGEQDAVMDRRRDDPVVLNAQAEATCCRHDDACRRAVHECASVGINRKALVPPRGPALPHRSTSLWSSRPSPSATGQSSPPGRRRGIRPRTLGEARQPSQGWRG